MNLRNYTIEEIKSIQCKKLIELIEFAGTRAHLAYMLDISTHTVDSWVERGRISKEGAKKVENHDKLGLKFKCFDLRPDMNIVK